MNVYQYLNSKDVAEHLEKIGFQFTSLEAARVIESCGHINLNEKHDAFRRLMEKMPDEEITLPAECGRAAEETTLHSLLKEYISAEEKMVQSFDSAEEGCIYFCEIAPSPDAPDPPLRAGMLLTYPKFQKEVTRLLKGNYGFYIHLSKFNLEKRETCNLCLDGKGNAEWVQNLGAFYKPYTVLCFESGNRAIPHPFKKGDLVCECDEKDRPFVFLDADEENVVGYSLEKGILRKEKQYVLPLDVEYYRGETKEEPKALQAVSDFVKENIDLAEFANRYHKAELEGYAEKIRISLRENP